MESFMKAMNKAGYPGADPMRAKAEALLGREMSTTPMNRPASFSTPAKTPMRLYKKGGHVKEFNHGGLVSALKKSQGGTIYEREMVGDHPSSKRPHINYEADMKGEKCVGHPKASKSSKNVRDASHGQYRKQGGHIKMAAGGVAKIRHGAATAEGKPIMKKTKKGY